MSAPWVISMVFQWALLLTLTVIVLSLVRQLGVIAIRLNPSAGLDMGEGPGVGSDLAGQEVPLLRHGTFVFAGERPRPLLTVFLSPDCSICNAIVTYVERIRRDYSPDDLDLFVILEAPPRVAREYVRDHDLDGIPVGLRQNFPNNHGIQSTPFAIALDHDGVVRARGTPNALDHLEEMIRSAQRAPDADEPEANEAEVDSTVLATTVVHGNGGRSQQPESQLR